MKTTIMWVLAFVLVIALIVPVELYFLGAIDTARYDHAAVIMVNGELVEGTIIGWQKISGTNQILVRFTAGEVIRTDAANVTLWRWVLSPPRVHQAPSALGVI